VAEQRGEFLLMKSLGDDAMLVYPEGLAAVSAGATIIEQTRQGHRLRVLAGAHVGSAIARDGDYYGSSVNLAARLLGLARPGQLIATREVVDREPRSYTTGNHSARGTSVAPRRWRAENLELARGEQRLARLAEDERPCAAGSTEHRR
jgi:class 3 adenylate cyclase